MGRPSRRAWLRAAAVALAPAGLAAGALAGAAGEVASLPRLPPISRADWQPQAGDVVLRASRDLVGGRIAAASGSTAIYSHVGVVVDRGGKRMIVDVSPYGSGVVEFTELTDFTTDPETSDLLAVRPRTAPDHARLAAEAERLAASRTAFDYDFDMTDRTKLYCSELAYHLLQRSGIDLKGVRWVDVDVPFAGARRLVTPDAFAHAASLRPIFRRRFQR